MEAFDGEFLPEHFLLIFSFLKEKETHEDIREKLISAEI